MPRFVNKIPMATRPTKQSFSSKISSARGNDQDVALLSDEPSSGLTIRLVGITPLGMPGEHSHLSQVLPTFAADEHASPLIPGECGTSEIDL